MCLCTALPVCEDDVHQGRDHEREGREQGRGQCGRAATICSMAVPKPRPGGKIGGPGEMYGVCTVDTPVTPPGTPLVTPPGPRGLHFSGRRPISCLQELVSNCVLPAAALRENTPIRKIVFSILE